MGSDLNTVVRSAFADGYVAAYEAENIRKYALKDDNTVTPDEKIFLRDAYQQGAYIEPYGHYVFNKLINYGEEKISDQMNDLRKQKHDNHWFNSEYSQHASQALIESTDSLSSRMSELNNLKREVNMFTSDYAKIGEQVLLNSSDSIVVRMNCLKEFKNKANLFNSEYAELGEKILLNSFDTKTARLMALEQFKKDAGLFSSDAKELADTINLDG